ncbi:MAG: DUF3089 domain-containing protein [Kiritimatiellaeota bacterium]|nr:DUF3089 domain-containing protein [Kiritimatiellota bacterium]
MKTTKKIIGLRACVAFVVLVILIFCEKGNATEATDYSIASHWLTVPATINKAVDVFYLYPTAWTSTNPNPEICAIDNPSMLVKAPESSALQVTAFEPIGNIYAPFYRQDNLSPIDRLNIIAGIPTLDAVAAFDYYIQNFNHGRPFILAGHSQGSDVLSNLLADYMKTHPTVLARMIAAYVIGFPITTEYLSNNPHLKFAEGPGDTGVIISYNTEAPDVVPPVTNPVLSGLIGVVINPITWTKGENLATTNQGIGSFMPDSNGVYVRVPQYADAQIDKTKGVLICRSADEDAIAIIQPGLPRGVYHNFDYPFYYFNIRSNAANRTQNFLNKYYSISSGVCVDYDGDGKSDPAVYRDGNWAIHTMAGSIIAGSWGEPGWTPVRGDYDGDGMSDLAVYRNGYWVIHTMAGNVITDFWGEPGWTTVSGDYDDDGKSDLAVYRDGNWAICTMAGNVITDFWGEPGWTTVSGDYDGDGKSDLAVYRNGYWAIRTMAGNVITDFWGEPGWTTVSGDYDGDGMSDLAVYRDGNWVIHTMAGNVITDFWGEPGWTPVSGDYDGDGMSDLAVYRDGNWAIHTMAGNVITGVWGEPGWTPVQ